MSAERAFVVFVRRRFPSGRVIRKYVARGRGGLTEVLHLRALFTLEEARIALQLRRGTGDWHVAQLLDPADPRSVSTVVREEGARA